MQRSVFHTVTDRLAAIGGPEHLRLDEDGSAIAIAPANAEQVSAILRFANENSLAVTPCGGGTKLDWGKAANRALTRALIPALTLETRRLDTLRDHTWQDMTATVEAGCRWSTMQSALARHGQFVALDPLWPDRATVGGIVAANDSGPLRLKYGSLRDLVIGMTIVLADGTIARTGGKVVKNVAGYDLHKLMIGAFGTLGIITEVTFRLHSVPRHTRSFTVTSPTARPLGDLLLKIVASHLSSQSIQLRAANGRFALDIRLSALAEVLDAETAPLAALAQSLELTAGHSESAVWNCWQEHADRQEAFTVKAAMLPSRISDFAGMVDALGGTSVTQATGIMLANFPAAAASHLSSLRGEFEAAGGSLTIRRAPNGVDLDPSPLDSPTLDPWGAPPDTLVLMREIKRRFDPNGILNAGRFLGGI